ncbi:MAG: ABC transporter permease [Planctomycetota bacterium]
MTQQPQSNPEARAGVSLTQDALRKLRRNRAAMASIYVLVGVCVLAFFAPVLPLQPPDAIQTPLAFAEPTVSPLFVKTFDLDVEAIGSQSEELRELRAEVRSRRAAGAEIEEVLRLERQIEDITQRPYRNAGFPVLGPLSRGLVQARHAVFGSRSLNSVCGRDKLGRDILSRIFWGSRVSLIVGLVATLVSVVIGVTYGAVSGYSGGWVDNLMMRTVDVLYSVPFIFLVIFVIAVLDAPEIKAWREEHGVNRILIFYFVVGAIYWLTMARVVRGQVLSLKNEPFVEAARSLGVSHAGVVFRHIVPNLLSVVIVYLTLTIPRVILFEAFLSFLGLGVEPPDVSWGLLANEGIKVITPVKVYWWLILFPSLAIGATLFALNFLGDGLRDAFDPRLRSQG